MKRLLILALVISSDPFQYHRQVLAPKGATACLRLPAEIFSHAAPGLNDLRLYADSTREQVPYVLTVSQSAQTPPDLAVRISQTSTPGSLRQVLRMPARAYTELMLDIPARNFVATARVFGLQTITDENPKPLATATVFDMADRRLARNTGVQLAESAYPYLLLELESGSPITINSVTVPADREAQTLYTTVTQTTTFTQHGHDTLAQLTLPAHVPVERLSFDVSAGADFSRPLLLTASAPHATPEGVTGEITRIHQAIPPIMLDRLSVPATLAANLRLPAEVEVTILNGDEKAVPFRSARLEMRQRSLCFLPPPGNPPLTLSYGDPSLASSSLRGLKAFDPSSPTSIASLGPEQTNLAYVPRLTPLRPFLRRHPEVPWLALLLGTGVLATLALRATHPFQRS